MTQFSHEIHENMTAGQSMYAGADDAKRPVNISISHQGAEETPDVFDQLETLIKEQLPRSSVADVLVHLGSPMVSIGVLDAGNITTKVLGSPRPNNNKTARRTPPSFNTDTIFQACSISKAMTAITVFKFCQEGKLDLNTPIYRYLTPEQLSWICTPKTYQLASQITIRQLLSHTAGLSVHGFRGYPADELPSLYQLLTGLPPANNAPVTVEFIPGQKYCYSGGGYSVIQLILERLERKSLYKIMEENLLKPLNMDRSTYQVLSLDGENYASAYLNGKTQANPDHHTQPEAAAAGLWTTPGDMLKAVRAIQESLNSGGFIAREWAERMLTEVEDNGVGLGWMGKKNDTYFFHPGDNMPGYTAWCGGYMNRENSEKGSDVRKGKAKQKEGMQSEREEQQTPTKCGMSIMVNSALGGRVIGKLLSAIAYLKGWPDVSTTYMEVPLVDRHKPIDVRALEWCGSWGPGKWTLLDDNGLFVKFGTSARMPLVSAAICPISYDEGQSIDLVVDGLEILLRLGWKDGSRVIELRQDRETKTLERQE